MPRSSEDAAFNSTFSSWRTAIGKINGPVAGGKTIYLFRDKETTLLHTAEFKHV